MFLNKSIKIIVILLAVSIWIIYKKSTPLIERLDDTKVVNDGEKNDTKVVNGGVNGGATTPPPIPKLTIDPSTITTPKASACAQALLELQNQLQIQRDKDTADYQAALTPWLAARDSAQASFNKDSRIWAGVCGKSPTECEPVSDFFSVWDGASIGGLDIGSISNVDFETCLRECRADTRCQMVSFRTSDGLCAKKRLTDENKNGTVGLRKTDNTFISYKDQNLPWNLI